MFPGIQLYLEHAKIAQFILSTLGSADLKSLVVTCLVCSSLHFTSSVNSTAQSGQKSAQVQSLQGMVRFFASYVNLTAQSGQKSVEV